MPPRTSHGHSFICRSCLVALQKRKPSAQWLTRHPSSRTISSARRSGFSPEKEAERQRTLELLGLSKERRGDKFSVKYFEKKTDGKMRPLRDVDEFNRSVMDLDAETEARLQQLEEQLEQATRFTKIVESIYGKRGAEELVKRAAESDPDNHPSVLLPEHGWPRAKGTQCITHLNNMIRTVGRKTGGGALRRGRINALWKYYSLARDALRGRPDAVYREFWDFLWRHLAVDHDNNPNRMYHVHILAQDMRKVGVALHDDQQLLAIEADFVSGFRKEAVAAHKRFVLTLGTNPETFAEFWELGLRMYCLMDDVDRAEQVVKTIVESPYEKDPRFLFPLIRMYASKPETVEKGYKVYQQLRSDLGDSITIDDYDTIILYFLKANETEFALFIFVDMMVSETVDLRGVHKLPPSVGNPFFFGKWLRRLISDGNLQGAHNVLLLSMSKGVLPQAIHVNGLIGAWLRSGTADNIQKAEDVAWAMINARMQFLGIRKDMKNLAAFIRLRPTNEVWPRANLETFSLLAENYKDRGLHAKMERLWIAFRDAEIPPNSFMLNQLLSSYLQSGQGKHIGTLSRDLTNHYRVEPDPWTFTVLWQALAVNRLVEISPQELPAETAQARSLFAEMVRSAHIFENGIDLYLSRSILHSFRKLEDTTGLLLAYRALRHIFKFIPSDLVVMELQVGSMDLLRTAKGRRGLRLMHAGQQVESSLRQRHQELIASGQLKAGEELPLDARTEELGNILERFLENQITVPDGGDIQALLRETAMEMGFGGDEPETKTSTPGT
ncbi:hypothetical protein GGS23DRAFT_291425 [Durotheca rogersii]|uniref:uncharacterized protein n=1 Tax=Durotheca rogersii TaxID=419775 RepID=UPI002220376E|nr:uncharacterized protein GGS23DRAFT_291425 [Durotheca rogersii]KAI5866834.1 hypothetical protein GGS23DRAFT_291425 [Durotheca rogersii]